MEQESRKIDLGKIANDPCADVASMVQELEGREVPSIDTRWANRFTSLSRKEAPSRWPNRFISDESTDENLKSSDRCRRGMK